MPAVSQVENCNSRPNTESRSWNGSDWLFPVGLLVAMATLWFFGDSVWDTHRYDARQGWGYWAGITGGVLVLLALSYAFFKHAPSLRALGHNRNVLRIHIIFGIAGPFILAVHSGLAVKSANGSVALYSMFAVFLSGVVGRFLYSKSRRYQDAHKIDFLTSSARLSAIHSDPDVTLALSRLSARVHLENHTLLSMALLLLRYDSYAREVRNVANTSNASGNFLADLSVTLELLKRLAKSRFFERFMAFWRYAHLPLILLMVVSGIVHVFAVHLY